MKFVNVKNNHVTLLGLMLYGTVALAFSHAAYALNYFELEVYPYKTAAPGEVEFENFTSYTRRGSQDLSAPENNKGLTRSTFEVGYGVTKKIEVAGYVDYSRARGQDDWDLKASRWRARTRFAEKGELPVDLGLYAEVGLPRKGDNDVEFELRGIVEKDLGKWTLDVNPIFEKVLKGVEKNAGWELQYAASAIYRLNERWHPRLDFFGDFGLLRDFAGRDQQKHLISPAVDIFFGHGMSATFGMGYGLTKASEQQLVRARFEWEFY